MGGLGVVYELLGHAKFEKILSVIGITNGFNKIWAVSIVSFLVWCVLYLRYSVVKFLLEKLHHRQGSCIRFMHLH